MRAEVIVRSLPVGAPGIRLIRRVARGDDGEAAGTGSAETAAMASSSVIRMLSFSTAVSWVAVVWGK